MIRVCETGRNPTMRHLNRTHGVCISGLKERFDEDGYNLFYERSAKQSGDIYTKMFDSADKLAAVCYLINVIDPEHLDIAEVSYSTTGAAQQRLNCQWGSVRHARGRSPRLRPPRRQLNHRDQRTKRGAPHTRTLPGAHEARETRTSLPGAQAARKMTTTTSLPGAHVARKMTTITPLPGAHAAWKMTGTYTPGR